MDQRLQATLLNRLREINMNSHDDKEHRVFACFFLLGIMEKQRLKLLSEKIHQITPTVGFQFPNMQKLMLY